MIFQIAYFRKSDSQFIQLCDVDWCAFLSYIGANGDSAIVFALLVKRLVCSSSQIFLKPVSSKGILD
jgi:hypothetical protein